MDKQETRRVNPVAQIAFLAVAILVVFEALVIGGVLELKAQTVAKYAPWAHEPFLRLVGEHPDSAPRRVAAKQPRETEPADLTVTGLAPSAMPVPMETNDAASATNVVLEPTVPVSMPTNPPPAKREEIVPVG